MAIDLTGISNENEFYTHHYLSAILENDLKDVFQTWAEREKEENIRQPHGRLKGLAGSYFNMCSRFEREKKAAEKLTIQHEFLPDLLDALGYEYRPRTRELEEGVFLPIAGEILRSNGAPEFWIIEALDQDAEGMDPLALFILKEQFIAGQEHDESLLEPSLEQIITRQVFGLSEPPRWVLVASHAQLVLIDRLKWNEKRLLRFDLSEILGRKEDSTLKAAAALLHRDSVCPEEGLSLLDTLDENSHKHAFAVSEDLKYALRESIELLGNEAIFSMRKDVRDKLYGRELADQLTIECLRYMYRLLFLFYIEARPELGYVPMKSDAYRMGYSLETLRDLEMVKLTTEESRNGYYLHDSIQMLFDLIYNGFPPAKNAGEQLLELDGKPLHGTFQIPPLRSHLFDPKRTAILNRVRLRNHILQKIIRLMSLSKPNGRRNVRRGRISYAQLGINQLGAVYEALLSYRGFFAENDLFEVKKAGEKYDELETAYFVEAKDLEQYEEEEKVYNADGSLKMYPKGTFIYRLAGRNREKSASYYTPEVLTRCLVKYALKELLKDKTADEILHLTVCEPAMGSAAFLNEAINQLAEAYLGRKQKELGDTIAHEDYAREKQKVKMYMADNNVFGVDLNPVAVELAEVSLWLNSILEGGFVPWFGMQLVCGNSLIGARRQVFKTDLLKKKDKNDPLWLDEVPERVMPGDVRPENTVYHFLLPDKGMANYKDKVVKEMAKEQIKALNDWRKDFTKPFTKSQIDLLKRLSSAIDKLWAKHTEQLKAIRIRTTDPIYVYGQPVPENQPPLTTTEYKDRIFQQELLSENVRNSSPYRRLKLAMDYWCALWFWPILKADLIPTREEFLLDLSLILEGNVFDLIPEKHEQMSMFPETMPKQMAMNFVDEFGYVDVDRLCLENKRLGLVSDLAENYHFLHWELEFTDLFESGGGFDLVLGNPPWVKVEWNERNLLGDTEPIFTMRNLNATQLRNLRNEIIRKNVLFVQYISYNEEIAATQNYFNSIHNQPLLKGLQTNLYKCFITIGWELSKISGFSAFITQDGIYSDGKTSGLRRECYHRLRYCFFFFNEKFLFDIMHTRKFELHVFGPHRKEIQFDLMANLFYPTTIDSSYISDGQETLGGIKNDKNEWNISGHRDRMICVTENNLKLFGEIFDGDNVQPVDARLPAIHSTQAIKVIDTLSRQNVNISNFNNEIFTTEMWHETNAQDNNTIQKETSFPNNVESLIISGSHFYVGNPLMKCAKQEYRTHHDFSIVDLKKIPDDYLPRSLYQPACGSSDYSKRIPTVAWDRNKRVTEFFRLAFRGMLSPSGERTLINVILPKGIGHIHGVQSTAFRFDEKLLNISAFCHSIIADYYIKLTGKNNLHYTWYKFPYKEYPNCALLRVLILNCLTQHYAELWSNNWNEEFLEDGWASNRPQYSNGFFHLLSKEWKRNCALRSYMHRRQALIELDVITAILCSLKLHDLKSIYRIQFPVLRKHEMGTWYDKKGEIVFTINSQGLPDVGFSRPEWNDIKDMQHGTVERKIIDDTMPGGPIERTIVYEAPFDRCDRERDYEIAWTEFEKRFGKVHVKKSQRL